MADEVIPAPEPTPLEDARQRLAEYRAAEREALAAQQYQVGDGAKARMHRMADLKRIQEGIAALKAEIATLELAAVSCGRRRLGRLR